MNRQQLSVALNDLGVHFIITKNKRHKVSKHLPLNVLRSELARLQQHPKPPPPAGVLQLIVSIPSFWKEIGSTASEHRSLRMVLNVLLVCRETKPCWASVFQGLADYYVRKSWCEKQLLLNSKTLTAIDSYTVEPAGFGQHSYLVGLIQLRDVHALLCARHGDNSGHTQEVIARMAVALNDVKRTKLEQARLRKENAIRVQRERQERQDQRERQLTQALWEDHGIEKRYANGVLFNNYVTGNDDTAKTLDKVAREIAFRHYLHKYTNYNEIVEVSHPFPGFHKHLRNRFREKIEEDGGLPAMWPWRCGGLVRAGTQLNTL